MGYSGQTLIVPLASLGYQFKTDRESDGPTSFVGESRNFNLDRDGLRKRGGTQKVNVAAVSGTPQILGIFDYRLSGSSFQVFVASDGSIYKNTTTTIKTGWSTSDKPSFAVHGDTLFICNGNDTPQTWDGVAASTSNITTPAADWSGTTQPFQFISHGKGASRRLWALMGNAVYYSVLGDGNDFAGTGSGKISIDSGDPRGLTGGIEFGDRLFVFSRDKAFLIDDTDVDPANWGYQGAQWEGGAAHWRVIVKTPNDVVVMTEDGDIYSLSAVQSYGDYKQASIARPAFMDSWLREKAVMSRIGEFHAIYDTSLRAVKFFIHQLSGTQNDTALVYFIDRKPETAWSIHDNRDATSGYKASCSALVKSGPNNVFVYTGGYDGFIWKLESSTFADDTSAYTMLLRSERLAFGNMRNMKEYKRLIYTVRGGGDTDISFNFAVDGVESVTSSFRDGATVWDEVFWDEFLWDTDDMVRDSVEIGAKGRNMEFEIIHDTVYQELFLGTVMLDHKVLGAAPK